MSLTFQESVKALVLFGRVQAGNELPNGAFLKPESTVFVISIVLNVDVKFLDVTAVLVVDHFCLSVVVDVFVVVI